MAPAPSRPSSLLARAPLVAAAIAALLLTAQVRADEVHLLDGRVLAGKVVAKGDTYEVTTRDGVVVVQQSEVDHIVSEENLRTTFAASARTAGDTAFANLQLAIQAQRSALEPEMWRHLDRAVEQRRQRDVGEGLQRRLDDFLAQLEPEVLPRRYRSSATKIRVHQLLDLVHASTGTGRTAAIEELLVREQGADQDLRSEARRNTNARQRISALAALQRRPLAGNSRFVLRTAILDGNDQVRDAAVALSRPTIGDDDLEYMAAGLNHSNPKVRVRTAEALGNLGKPEAVKWLVLAGPTAGTGLAPGGGDHGVRAHVAFLTQTSYIRDYDVEVAQAAMIADPKVDVVTSGSVLDVTVAGVWEERIILRAYRVAIKQLSQNDPGEDPRKWAAWLANAQPAAPAPAPATTPAKR